MTPAETATSEELLVKYQKATGYTSGLSTGIMISGPTPDGMMQLNFYHDVLFADHERFAIKEKQVHKFGSSMKLDPIPVEPDLMREIIATVVIPVDRFEGILGAMKRSLELVAEAKNAAPK